MLMLVGNKCDLEDARRVQTQEATAFAARQGMAFEETSALDATGVEKSFHTLITEIYRCVKGGCGMRVTGRGMRGVACGARRAGCRGVRKSGTWLQLLSNQWRACVTYGYLRFCSYGGVFGL